MGPYTMSLTRRLRLLTGLVLFAYVTTHLANHALGLMSLEAMEGRFWFLGIWRHPIGSLLLYGSLITHVALAFWALYERRTLRMPAWEAVQLGVGLAIPPLLVSHIIGTRVTWQLYGVEDAYSRVIRRAGVSTHGLPRHELTLRNRAEPLAVLVVRTAATLSPSRSPAR